MILGRAQIPRSGFDMVDEHTCATCLTMKMDGERPHLRVADPEGILGTSDDRPSDLQDGGVATY